MITKIVWICAGVAVLAAGVILYRVNHVSSPTMVEQQLNDSAIDYSIGIKYPFFSGVENQQDLNNAVWSLLTGKANDFKAAVKKRNPSRTPVAHKSAFYVEYTSTVFNPALAVIRFKISSYFTGDSHPSTTIAVFSYDLENNSVIPTP